MVKEITAYEKLQKHALMGEILWWGTFFADATGLGVQFLVEKGRVHLEKVLGGKARTPAQQDYLE